jgi:single-stranded-DNA-specific exonuclease
MISISGKNWEEVRVPKRLIDKVKIDFDLNETQAKIALSRNYTNQDFFLINNEIKLNNPFLNTDDFLLGCEILNKNIKNQNNILIIGDYDVDGCMSTSIFFNFLKENNNANIHYYIPDRFKDGYGASKDLIIILSKRFRPNLIIFLDCGSNSYEAIKYLKSKKINTLILDHHNTTLPYPVSDVFINPKKKVSTYNGYDYLCTTFLTYLFLDVYIRKYKVKKSIQYSMIYVLLATVADVMPMKGINKILAKNVLLHFDISKNLVFKNLFKILQIKNKLTIYDLGYKIAPLINSAGRLENANEIIELFTTKMEEKIYKITSKLIKLNDKRKLIEKRILDELNYLDLYNEKGVLFVYKPNLHEGVIGILASRVKDYFDKPCIILTNSGDILKGSARSTSNFNIGEYIQNTVKSKILLGGGGHNLAAGASLKQTQLINFKNYINNQYNKKKSLTKNSYLSILSFNSINKQFFESLEKLGPFGNENSQPIFLIKNIKFTKQKIIKDKFIKCFIKKGAKLIKSISFNHIKSKISYQILNYKKNLDALVKVKINNWNNKNNIELEIIDIINNTIKLD